MDTTFKELSYNISCEHMKHLNNRYNNDNDMLYRRQFICNDINDINDNDDKYKKYINYLDSIYISKKTCIYKSTEPDNLEWTSIYNGTKGYEEKDANLVIINNAINTVSEVNGNSGIIVNNNPLFNQNTRRKIIKT